MGWDGMGWDGMDGMGYQKCPSIFFILCIISIYNMYICTYIDNRKLSPTFLWVSKFVVKLGFVVKNFKITDSR